MKIDLAIACRIFGPQKPKPNVLGLTDKLDIVTHSMQSLRKAIGGLNVKMCFIMDCPEPYWDTVKTTFASVPVEFVSMRCPQTPALHRQFEILASQTDADLVYFAEDDYLYRPDALEAGVEFMRQHPKIDAVSLAYHAEYDRRWLDRLNEPAITFAGRQWRRQIASTHSFMMRRQSLVAALPTFLHHITAGDLATWLSLTKFRVFNPWAMIRGWGDGKFIPGSIGLSWFYHYRQILTGRKFLLYSPKPTLATHMETKSAALDWTPQTEL